jgi:hypothetical protein
MSRRSRLIAIGAGGGALWAVLAYWTSWTWRIAPTYGFTGLLLEVAFWPFFRGVELFGWAFYDLVVCCPDQARWVSWAVVALVGAVIGVGLVLAGLAAAWLGGRRGVTAGPTGEP